MSINIIDTVIVLIVMMGAIVGMKRGVIKQSVMTIGLILVLVLSFLLKNPVSALMYKYMPFISFHGLLENLAVLNILLYEIIAFGIVFSVLSAILIALIKISSILEKILRATVILAIPSKILGFILGAVEYYLVVFIILFVLSQPTFKIEQFDFVSESKLKPIILENTPIISDLAKKTIDTFNDINDLIKNKDNMTDEEFNCKALNSMIENKFIDKDSIKYLYDNKKLTTKCEIGE